MDRLNSRPRIGPGRPRRRRDRARSVARYGERFLDQLLAGRTALSSAARIVSAAGAEHGDVSQQCEPDGAAGTQLGRLHARQRHRRRRRALERGDLPVPADRFHGEDAPHPTLRRELLARGHDDSGLGRHLRRARAALRRFRIPVRHVGDRRQRQRQDPAGRQSVRGRALAAVSDPGAEAGLRPHAVRQGRRRNGLQALSAAVRKSVAGLYQPARRQARPVHLLRLLRMVRLRQLFQGEPADHHPAGAVPLSEFRSAQRVRGHPHQSRPLAQGRDRRHLCRFIRRRMGAARRSRDLVRLPALERPASARLRHRPALRSEYRTRPCRTQLHPSDRVGRARLLRQGQIQLQSVHRVGRDRHDASTSSTATISIMVRWGSSAAAISGRYRPTAGRSRSPKCRPVPRPGA